MTTLADNTRNSSIHVYNIGFQRQFRVCHSLLSWLSLSWPKSAHCWVSLPRTACVFVSDVNIPSRNPNISRVYTSFASNIDGAIT